MTNNLPDNQKPKLVTTFANNLGVEPEKMLATLKNTCFKQDGDNEITNEQMMALLIVADQYNLNPFTREIYAFPHKGGIVPIVGVDGWISMINDQPALSGIEFVYSEEMVEAKNHKKAHEWMDCYIYRNDRKRPIVVREYFDELYKPTQPWNTHTKRMHRHKTLIQCARVAFGYSGIYDEDEAERIIEGEVVPQQSDALDKANAALNGEKESVTENGVNTLDESRSDSETKSPSSDSEGTNQEAVSEFQLVLSAINDARRRDDLDAVLADSEAYENITQTERDVIKARYNKRINELMEKP